MDPGDILPLLLVAQGVIEQLPEGHKGHKADNVCLVFDSQHQNQKLIVIKLQNVPTQLGSLRAAASARFGFY